MKRIPIDSPFGILYGRDKIHLDKVLFDNGTSTIILIGSITDYTESNPDTKWRNYRLTFSGVLAFMMVELDSSNIDVVSSFDEVTDSDWVKSLGGKVTPQHRHIYVQTYDDVFDVVCESYKMIESEPGPN